MTAKKNTIKKKNNVSSKITKDVVEKEIVEKNTGININFAVIILVAALLLTFIYMAVDSINGWGDESKVIRRKLGEAEKHTFGRQYSKAAKIYENIINKYGDDEKLSEYLKQAALGLAKTYADSQQYIKAIDAYKELAQEYKNINRDMYAWLMLELGSCYNNIFNSKDAISVYRQIIKEFPDTDWAAEAYFGIADAYRNDGQNALALKFYGIIADKYKKGFLSAEALTNMGKIYESESRESEAVRIYERVVKDFPEIVTEYARLRMEALKAKPAR